MQERKQGKMSMPKMVSDANAHHRHVWNPSHFTLLAQTPLEPSTASLPLCTLSEQVLAGANSGPTLRCPILWNLPKPITHGVSILDIKSKIRSSSNAIPIYAGLSTASCIPAIPIYAGISTASYIPAIPIYARISTASYIPVCTIPEPAPSPTRPPITGQTLAIITVCAIAIPLYKVLLSQFHVLSLKCSGFMPDAGGGAKPFSLNVFYAGSGKKDARSAGIAGISAGVTTLIKIYALVLAGRVLLNFIPNVPWEKQPMAALSQMTDPYLHMFQNTAPLEGEGAAVEETKKSNHVLRKIEKRQQACKLDAHIEEQFSGGRLLASISSCPGQCGRADEYILEGKELEFYMKKLQKKKGKGATGATA